MFFQLFKFFFLYFGFNLKIKMLQKLVKPRTQSNSSKKKHTKISAQYFNLSTVFISFSSKTKVGGADFFLFRRER